MIATAWGWPPSELAPLSWSDLLGWLARADAVLQARGARVGAP